MNKFLCLAVMACMGTLAFSQKATVTRPAITGIAGVGLAAQSLPADRAFYEKTLGWTAAPSVEAPNGSRFYGVPKQWVEVLPATSADEHPFRYVAFATTDANQMRLYLAQHGVTVPSSCYALDGRQPGLSREGSGREHNRIYPEGRAACAFGSRSRCDQFPDDSRGVPSSQRIGRR